MKPIQRIITLVAAAAVGAVLPASSAAASTAAAGGHAWGKAIEVPGSAALNLGGNADLRSVSCASAGNCSAGGYYQDSSYGTQAFVVSQAHGTWGPAIEVPGSAALNLGGDAEITSVSCASAGNCSAGGDYHDSAGNFQVFVVSQVDGTWGPAIEVPGTAALNQGGNALLFSVSCGAAGNCSAGGTYTDSLGGGQAFVISQVDGAWGTAIEVPGTATLNQSNEAVVFSVSCASAGNCSAGGDYSGSPGRNQAFVVSQVHGTWEPAIAMPGSLNQGHDSQLSSLSCGRAGNCSAGGFYVDSSGHFQAFVISQAHGTWAPAIEVPGTAALNRRGFAEVSSVSCASAGNCSAGGNYLASSRHIELFVVSEVHGTWEPAIEVPGIAALNRAGDAGVAAVSCGSAGNCSAGGNYQTIRGHFHLQAWVVSQVHGRWGTAIEVPGTAALNRSDYGGTDSVSCPRAGECSAGGGYMDSARGLQAFVVSES